MEKVELQYWWEHSDEKNMNELVEWKAFVDTYRLRVPIWKINFCSRVLRLSELPKCKERPQIAMRCLEWLGKLKCLATGFDASLSFSESVTYSSSCFANVYLFAINASYAIDHIGGGARKVISDLNGSLRSRYFVGVVNERTSFASCASALILKVPGWSLVWNELLTNKIAYVFVVFEWNEWRLRRDSTSLWIVLE